MGQILRIYISRLSLRKIFFASTSTRNVSFFIHIMKYKKDIIFFLYLMKNIHKSKNGKPAGSLESIWKLQKFHAQKESSFSKAIIPKISERSLSILCDSFEFI